MEVGYHNAPAARGSPLPHFATPRRARGVVRFLAVCCPGGPATHNLVDAESLRALGPGG